MAYTELEAMTKALNYALQEEDLTKALNIATDIFYTFGYSDHLERTLQRIMYCASLRDNGIIFSNAACLYHRICTIPTETA